MRLLEFFKNDKALVILSVLIIVVVAMFKLSDPTNAIGIGLGILGGMVTGVALTKATGN